MQNLSGVLTSIPNKLIARRFLIKMSVYREADKEDSIVMIITDAIGGGFAVKHFSAESTAKEFINSLKDLT